MIEYWRIKLSNLFINITWKLLFRTSYSPRILRRHMELLSGASAKALNRKFPNAGFEPVDIEGLKAELITSAPDPGKTILYLHGGSYIIGSISSYRRNALRLSYHCNARVLVIDYRRAPEHPCPAAIEDALEAYRYLLRSTPASSVVLGGDSAGGGLALSTLHAIRDEKLPLPSGAFVFSPWADLSCSGESHETHRKKDVWLTQAQLLHFASAYLGGLDPKDPRPSPAFADYRGLPPLLVFGGDQEVLYSDACRVVDQAQAAGCRARLEIGPLMQHAWPLAFPYLNESRIAYRKVAEFLRQL